MKNLFLALSALSALILTQTNSFAQFTPAHLSQLPEKVFAPGGFDDNDNSQVVLFGHLPDTCHKVGNVRYDIDEANRTITINNEVLRYSSSWCSEMLIPYTQVVNLGILSARNYTLKFQDQDGNFKTSYTTLTVGVAHTASPDDYLYAPVSSVTVTNGKLENVPELVISGTFTNTCMTLSDVKVNYPNNDVIEILPILEIVKGTDCQDKYFKFSTKVKLDIANEGMKLIHVRSLNGQAINEVSYL